MKSFLLVLLALLTGCVEHIGYKDENTWAEGRINIVIDDSVDLIGEPSTVRGLIEESFMLWADETDRNLDLNFIHGHCTENADCCVRYGKTKTTNALADFYINFSDGYFHESEIVISDFYDYRIYTEGRGYCLHETMLHEAGHFFGLMHSNAKEDVMYHTRGIAEPGQWATLSAGDIKEFKRLYK